MAGNKKIFIIAILIVFIISFSAQAEKKKLSGLNTQDFEDTDLSNVAWGNNPFVIPANAVPVSDLRLTGIVYGIEDSAAIINDQVVRVGDKIGYNEIVGIEKERVIVRNDNGLFGISFEGGRGVVPIRAANPSGGGK
jgi:hypothetical protein